MKLPRNVRCGLTVKRLGLGREHFKILVCKGNILFGQLLMMVNLFGLFVNMNSTLFALQSDTS